MEKLSINSDDEWMPENEKEAKNKISSFGLLCHSLFGFNRNVGKLNQMILG